MVGQFELPALRIDSFLFQKIAGHEPQKFMGEVRVVVEWRVRLV